jgi:thiol-disulfide isomerase/thioredoxin
MKYMYLCLLCLLFSVNLYAQEVSKPSTVASHTFSIDQKTIVKDSSGKQYSFKDWNALTRTRQYFLWPENVDDPHTAFIIKRMGSRKASSIQDDIVEKIETKQPEAQKQLSAEEIKEQYFALLPKPRESTYFTVGETMEPFSTRDLNNNKIKLKELRGKVVVLNFWFIGCPACMQEIPELNKLVDNYKDNPNVVFLAIALDYSYEIKKFLKTTAFNYDIIDNGRYIADGYKINLYPTSVILDKEGKVAFHTVGFAPNSPYWMRKTINESLK